MKNILNKIGTIFNVDLPHPIGESTVSNPIIEKQKTTYEIIQDIHNEFDSASDKAYLEAKKILDRAVQFDIDKAKTMKSLGFNTPLVESLNKRISEDSSSSIRASIIQYYQQKYPQYKFIFKNQVEEICNKYGLVYGTIDLYKGDVPIKNLEEISDFQLEYEDIFYKTYSPLDGIYSDSNQSEGRKSYKDVMERDYASNAHFYRTHPGFSEELDKLEIIDRIKSKYIKDHIVNGSNAFKICAPKKDMNMKGMRTEGVFVKNIKVEIPDPIVLYPQPNNGGYIIVSKWGLEANDPIVANEKMN